MILQLQMKHLITLEESWFATYQQDESDSEENLWPHKHRLRRATMGAVLLRFTGARKGSLFCPIAES